MQVVDITDWQAHEDHAIFPIGSKPKRMVIAPTAAAPPLIAGHSYLFKTVAPGQEWLKQQIWAEVIANQVGELVGVPVPQCFIAYDDRNSETGVLIEFFYGYPGEAPRPRFVHGSDLLTAMYPEAKERGRPHALRTNLAICRRYCSDTAHEWWGKVITFDALIGNVDRHTENWGLLVTTHGRGAVEIRIAPAFDHGTSFGYEQREEVLSTPWEHNRLQTYVMKGKHHCSWEIHDVGVRGHTDLCRRFANAYPTVRDAMMGVLAFEREQIASILEECVQVDVSIPFSAARARFVSDLVDTRRRLIGDALGDSNG